MIEQSEQLNELGAALAKAQTAIRSAAKDATNPHFKSHYADLPAVVEASRGALTANNIAVIQLPLCDPENGRVIVSTMLLHASGQWIRSAASALPRDLSPQSVGSAITYLRRYGLASMVGVVADDDDDGNAAQPTRTQSSASKEAPAKPANGSYAPAIKPDDPRASSIETLATPKQLAMAQALCKDMKRNIEDAVSYYFPDHQVKAEELNRQAMSYLIDQLKQYKEKL